MVQRLQRVTHSLKHSNENDSSISFEKRVVAQLTESTLESRRYNWWAMDTAPLRFFCFNLFKTLFHKHLPFLVAVRIFLYALFQFGTSFVRISCIIIHGKPRLLVSNSLITPLNARHLTLLPSK